MKRLCQYRDLLGEPGKGAHSIRIFNIAVVDVVLTFLGAWLIAYGFKLDYLPTLIIFFVLGVFLHWLFCVNTTINDFLGLGYDKK